MDDGRAAPDRVGRASIVRVGQTEGLPAALDGLGVRRGRPVLVLVGGAAGMDDEHLEILRGLLAETVLPVVDQRGAAVVDGGTDSGVMRVIGRARAADNRGFSLVGVAAEGTVDTADQTRENPDAAALEPHHTHFVLVPGTEWGDESPWLGHVAEAIADGGAILTMVVNGGEITFDDVSASLTRHRPVLVLAGTGRTADAIADARSGRDADPRAVAISASPLTRVLFVTDRAGVAAVLDEALPGGSGG
jgi:SLOG in TRPM, prokaryote